MFHNAQNLSFSGGAFYNVNGDLVQRQDDIGAQGINLLREHIAPGAFHNSDERYNPPKCHPRTRQAILDKLIAWIEDMDPEEFRTFWLYGSAGVGKSAILQTIAELCHGRGLLLASFFFSRTSATRNNRSRLIPTLSYQIALSSPVLQKHIGQTVAKDPTIFKRSLDVQLRFLVVEPLLKVHGREDSKIPPLIVLDGLDECSPADDQCCILREFVEAFQHHLLGIRLLIASRPEQRILTAFNCGALQQRSRRLSLDDHALLSEAHADIEVFLRHKFLEIKTSHPFRAYIPADWPTNSDVAIILRNASHHFIFVSTVIRFVGSPRHLPVQRLRVICDASFKTEETPFAELDALYLTILACVENMKPVIEILGFIIVRDIEYWRYVPDNADKIFFISTFMGYTPVELRCHLMDLSSLVDLDVPDYSSLRIFHASFSDFLTDKTRSKECYINHGLIHAHLAKLCLQYCSSWWKESVVNQDRFIYVRYAMPYHLREATHTRELRQQLTQFDVTSMLLAEHPGLTLHTPWVLFGSIMEQLRISTFPEAEATFTQQLRHLENYLKARLPIYQSDVRLRDLVTFISHPTSHSVHEGPTAQLIHFSWGSGILDLTEYLRTKDAQSLDIFFAGKRFTDDSGLSLVIAFLHDQARAGEFFVDGGRYASLALRFAKHLCEPSVQTRNLINDERAHRKGLRLFAFFLSRSSYPSELKEYLTSHPLVFHESVEFIDAVQAILTYVELAPPSTTSNL